PKMNFLPLGAAGQNGRFTVPGGEVIVPAGLSAAPVEVGIRPEHLELVDLDKPHTLTGVISMTEHLGSDTYAYVTLAGAEEMLVVRLSGERAVKRHETIGIAFDPEMIHVFSSDGKAIA